MVCHGGLDKQYRYTLKGMPFLLIPIVVLVHVQHNLPSELFSSHDFACTVNRRARLLSLNPKPSTARYACHCLIWPLNPKRYTLNPQSLTLNPKHLNPKPSIREPKPQTPNPKALSTSTLLRVYYTA